MMDKAGLYQWLGFCFGLLLFLELVIRAYSLAKIMMQAFKQWRRTGWKRREGKKEGVLSL
ncbi:hypothetical protein BCR42DRAFT_402115 [Absidia repens]|uniref:Uncharacterized protein n=1 Tax=Absidia repens TaxID=90262 RepID=A0A1X2IXJ1_9FUNG|nr:hypothetical protein BCR42DRAFT_402115 [Absidia repens]